MRNEGKVKPLALFTRSHSLSPAITIHNIVSAEGVKAMLKLALFMFVISVITGFLGFSKISGAAAGIAKVLFFIAIAIFLLVLIFGVMLGTLVL